jgi:LysR family hydrogen peroxide-inducible transcriptional activator
MDLKQLEALVGIADHGSFSAAAAALGTVQSNVSGRIARLERELDASLVDRSSGQLTEEGAIVASRSRHILGELDAIFHDVIATRSEVSGTVRAGMIGTTGRWLIPRLFEALQERHPRVRLQITEGTTATLEPQLLGGQLDFAILTTPIQSIELAVQPLFEEDLVLVLPTEHPLALAHARGTGPLPLIELKDFELLLPMEGTALRDEIDKALEPVGVTPFQSIELDGLRTIASLVFDGYGPAILPATAVPDHLRAQFRLLELEGLPRRHVGVVSRRHGLPSAPVRAVREVLFDIVADPRVRREGIHAPTPGT